MKAGGQVAPEPRDGGSDPTPARRDPSPATIPRRFVAEAARRPQLEGYRVEPLFGGSGEVWVLEAEGAVGSLADLSAEATAIAARAGIERCAPDGVVNLTSPSASASTLRHGAEDVANAWAFEAIRWDEAAELAPQPGGNVDGTGIRIGHPDTGYTDHSELAGVFDLRGAKDAIDGDDDPRDELVFLGQLLHPSHGTSTAALMAGRRTIRGVAPGASVVPYRCVLSVVQVFDTQVSRAVADARRAGCDVVSMSLGGAGFIGLRHAIRAAVADGMIVVAAAGNNITWVCPPAAYPETIAVAGIDRTGRPWAGSGRGPQVDIAAPADGIRTAGWSERRQPIVGEWSGTSFATAMLAGVAARWLAHHAPGEIRARYGGSTQAVFARLLAETARRPDPWDDAWGPGVVDLHALLSAPLPPAPT